MMIQQDKIQAFWQQVEHTIEQLLYSDQGGHFTAENLLSEYRQTLQRIDRNLTFHFEKDEEGPVEMIFGCDGYPESIHSVLVLVGAAPELQGIRFKAFNHRYDPVPQVVNVEDELCELAAFWYSLTAVAGKLHLVIYMEEAPSLLDNDPRIEAVMIFLDALIGEYELMTRIWSLDWFELPDDPLDFGLQPLAGLRERFDQLKADITPIGIRIH